MDSYVECLKFKRLIDPVLTDCSLILKNQEEFREQLTLRSEWTNSTAEVVEIFEEFCCELEENAAVLLRIMSVLEHALGNVFMTITNQKPPHLLRDLLQEVSEFESLFERNQVIVKSLNALKQKLISLITDFYSSTHSRHIKRCKLEKSSLAWIHRHRQFLLRLVYLCRN